MNKSANININPKRGNSISRALNTATRKVRAFNTGNNKTMKGLKDTIISTLNKPKVNKEQSVSHTNIGVDFVEPNEEKGDGDAGTDTERPSRAAEALQQSIAARARADQHIRNEEQLNKPVVAAATKLQALHRGRIERKKQTVEKEAAHEVRKVWEAAGKSEEEQKMAAMAARAAWKQGKEAVKAGKSQEDVQKAMMAARVAYEQAHAVKEDDKEDVPINERDGRKSRVAVVDKEEEEEDDNEEDVPINERDGRKSRVAVVDKEEEEEDDNEEEDSDDDKEKIMTEKQAPVVKADGERKDDMADAVITGEKDGAGVGLDKNQLADEANRAKVVPDKEQLAEKEALPVLDKDMADIEAHLEHDTRTRRSVEEAKRDEEKDALAALEKYMAWQEARKKDEPVRKKDEPVRKKDEPVDETVDKIAVKPAPKAGWPTPSEFTRKTINAAAYGSKVANDWTLGLGEFKSEYKKIISKILNENFADEEQNKLLNYIIVYSNKKKSIRDILAFNISSIFSRGETSLNIYRQVNLKKNFNVTEDVEEAPKKGGAKQEEDEQTGGLGSYGFRNFDEEDAIKFTTLILNSLSELYKIDNPREDDKLTNNQALLFEKYLKSLFGKVGPKTLNGLLPQIDNATIVSELVIQHFINRLKADNAAKEKNKDDKVKDDKVKDKVKDKDEDDTPAKKLSQLNFSLKHNAAPFAAAIVDITLNTQELKGNEGEIENYLDRKYDIAMKKPHDEEKAHIANSQLRDVFKTIFGESISTINIYRENIRKMDEIIDTINDKNIKTKFKDIEKLLVFAKIDKGVITYKMPPKIMEKLELQPSDDTAEDKLARALALITELQNAITIEDVKSKVGASRLLL
jgi:hypothetical protein